MRAEAIASGIQTPRLSTAAQVVVTVAQRAWAAVSPQRALVGLGLTGTGAGASGQRTARGGKRGRRKKPASGWQRCRAVCQKVWAASGGKLMSRLEAVRPARRLRLCEAVPLGEKRFVAVVQFERSRFLIGGAPNSVVLLTRLEEDGKAPFTEALAIAEQGHA